MLEGLADAATGEITVASRDAILDGVEIREGAYLGLVEAASRSRPDFDLDAVVRRGRSSACSSAGRGSHDPHGRGCAAARRIRRRPRGATPRPRGRGPRGRTAALPAALRRRVSDGVGAHPRPPRRGLRRLPRIARLPPRRTPGSRGRGAPSATAPPRFVRSASCEPDVVVLDYRLPDIDGATVAAELEADGVRPAIVFLSASAGPRGVRCRVERGRRARAQGRGDRRARPRSPRSSREVSG